MIESAKFQLITVDYGYRGQSRIIGCNGLSFDASPGRVTFLRGNNGSGKSSFFRALLNSAPYISGFVYIDHSGPVENEPDQIRVQELASRYRISYLPQSPTDALPAGMSLDTANRLWEKIHPIVTDGEWVGLREVFEELKHKDKDSISVGQAQIISLYLAARRNADFYLLDEPSASISSGNSHRISAAIKQLVGTGRIVIVTSHDDRLLSQFQDQEMKIVELG